MTQRQQIVITRAGGPDVLQVREDQLAAPAANEVQVTVAAAGINFADILARQGLYQDAPPLPCTVGYEVAGTVRQLGAGVPGEWLGRRVFGLTRFGGYASHVNVPLAQMFEMPAGMDFQQAAAIPVNYLTAWQLLCVMGNLKASETLLIQNAGGGVGLALIDIGKQLGARLLGTASAGKHAFLHERGLDKAIDYTRGDWLAEVMRLTDGRGVELVTDPLGGDSWRKSLRALRHTGRLGMFGVSEASANGVAGKLKLLKTALKMPFIHPVSLMNENRGTFGVNMGHLWHEVDKIRDWMDALLAGWQDGWVRPHVDRAFAFSEAGEAHAWIEARRNIGKVLLVP